MQKYNWTPNQVKAYFRQNPAVEAVFKLKYPREHSLAIGATKAPLQVTYNNALHSLQPYILREGKRNRAMQNKPASELLSYDMIEPKLREGVTEADWNSLSGERKTYWANIILPLPLQYGGKQTAILEQAVNNRLDRAIKPEGDRLYLPLTFGEEQLIKNIKGVLDAKYSGVNNSSYTSFLIKTRELKARKRQRIFNTEQENRALKTQVTQLTKDVVAERAKTEALRNANEQATRQTRAETSERLASFQRALETQQNAIANTNAGASQQQTRGYQPQMRTQDGVVKLYQDRIRRRLNLAPSRIVFGDTDTATPDLYLTFLKTQGARSKK